MVTTQIVPDGLGVPPYIEFRLQNAEAWGFSARYGMVVEASTGAAFVPEAGDPPGPTGHGWYATPITSEGYNWTLTGGELTIDAVNPSDAAPTAIELITGSGAASFGGESAIELSFSFADFPVVAQ